MQRRKDEESNEKWIVADVDAKEEIGSPLLYTVRLPRQRSRLPEAQCDRRGGFFFAWQVVEEISLPWMLGAGSGLLMFLAVLARLGRRDWSVEQVTVAT